MIVRVIVTRNSSWLRRFDFRTVIFMPFAGRLLGSCRGGHTVNVQLALPPSQFLLKLLFWKSTETCGLLPSRQNQTQPQPWLPIVVGSAGSGGQQWPLGTALAISFWKPPLGGTAPPLSPCWLEVCLTTPLSSCTWTDRGKPREGTGCGQAVGRVVSATQAAATGYCGWRSSSAAEIYFLGFGGRQAPNQGAGDSGCSRGPIPGSQTVYLLLCPRGVEGTRELSRALILFKRR